MSGNKWVRSVSFNKTNPDDARRLKLIGRKSFSKFVKKLIDDEIERQGIVEEPKEKSVPDPKPEPSKLEQLKRRQEAIQNKKRTGSKPNTPNLFN